MLKNQPSDKDVFDRIDNTFDTLDATRAQGLARLKTLRQTRKAVIETEKARLKKKYGPDHARIQKMDDRLRYQQGASRELDEEIEKAGIKVPAFDINTWMIHGRVLNSDGKGIDGLTLSLSDGQGTWMRVFGHACTDERGYFALCYKVDSQKALKTSETQELFLTVTNSTFKVLHRESEPLAVALGQIDFRLIVLKNQDGICAPPEPGSDCTGGMPSDVWLVRGRVLDKNGNPKKNMTVSLYDKDLLFDDKLGTTMTDEEGRFIMPYHTRDFRDLIESKPDIYLKVLDSAGKVLYSSKKKYRAEAGRVENLTIKLQSQRE